MSRSSLPGGPAHPVRLTVRLSRHAMPSRVAAREQAARRQLAASPLASEFAERAQPVTCKHPDKLLPAKRNHFMESSKALPKAPRGALRVPPPGSSWIPGAASVDVGQASVLDPKQPLGPPRGQRCGCPSLQDRSRDAAALLPRGAAAAPLGLSCQVFVDRPPLTFPSHLQGRHGVKKKKKSPLGLSFGLRPTCLNSPTPARASQPALPPGSPVPSPCQNRPLRVKPSRPAVVPRSPPEAPRPTGHGSPPFSDPHLQSQASPFPPQSPSGAQRVVPSSW